MAEIPSVEASVPIANSPAASAPTPDAGELRIANVPSEQAIPEAPQSLRGAAIAKLLANKDRKPKTENKPCWDNPSCREVQLGIPSPSFSSVETPSEPTAASTAEVFPESQTDLPGDASTETSAIAPTDTPAANTEEAPTGASEVILAEPSIL